MKKKIISTKKVPSPDAHYSQAVRVGNLVFTSGETSRDSKKSLLHPGDIEAQTHVVMKIIESILEEAGTSLSNVIKVNAFIDDISKFDLYDNVYKQYFPEDIPARTTVEIGNFREGVCIEIDAIALVPDE